MNNEVRFYTLEEAVEKGIPYKEQTEHRCDHCGELLEQLGFIGYDGVIHWVIRKDCDCEEAAAIRESERKRLERQERRSQEEKLLRAGVARRYLNASVSRPESVRFIESFDVGTGTGLYYIGGVGAGKTSEASAVAKSFVWAGYSVVFATSLAMLDAIRASYDGKSGAGIDKFVSADLLVLDDLGKENANSWALATLFQVLNGRYENLLPTIFTSQYTIDALGRRMSRNGERESAQAIVSRISQVSEVVNLGSADRRRGRQA